MQNFEGAVKSADIKLSVAGGDAGKGAKAQKTEITIYTLRHGVVRVEDVESTAYASIDVVCDKVRGKLRRLKEKAMQKGKWPGSARPRGAVPLADELAAEGGATSSLSEDEGEEWEASAAAAAAAAAPGTEAAAPELLREKTFVLTRMTAADAAEAADLLGHSFYVYEDAAAGGVRVVYKRAARGYGVIIPTIAQ
jgi:putative sigma-54 modulation protein